MKKVSHNRLPHGTRGPEVRFELDGQPCIAFEGETIATVLLAEGRRTFRLSPKEHQPRGLYCGMGVCFECIVTVNGILNVRACMTPVEAGMKIETGVPSQDAPKGSPS